MASFDPSIISQIPDMAPNPIEAKAKAYTLKDLINQEQLGKMTLNREKAEQADLGKIKDVLSKSDISTFEGQTKATEAAMKINPKLAKDLQSSFSSMQSAKYQKETQDLQMAEMQQNYIAGSLDSVLAEADQVRKNGGTDAMVNATIMRGVTQQLENLKQQTLPNGKPVLTPQVMQALGQGPITYDKIKSLEMQSNKGQELIKQRLAERKQETTEAQEKERERHDLAMEAKGTGTQKKPWSGREKIFSERILTSANEAGKAIKNITELPVGASSGVFGVGGGPGHSLLGSAKGALTNSMSSQEVQDYNTMLAGVRRNLATIESVGLAPSGALTEGFSSLELRAGDTNLTKLRKLAEMRQIIDAGLEVQLADPAIPDSIKSVMHKVQDTVSKAVPYTQSDVTTLQRAQRRNPDLTLEQLIGQQGLRPGNDASAGGWKVEKVQ